jgi:ribonuclease P protein component
VKIDHVLKSEEFKKVLEKGFRVKGKNLALYVLDTPGKRLSVGAILSKKNARLAITRNYIKRVLYSFYRENSSLREKKVVAKLNKPFDAKGKGLGVLVRNELVMLEEKIEKR